MLASLILSKLLLEWIVVSSFLIALSTSFTFLLMDASLELLLARVWWLFALSSKVVVYRIISFIKHSSINSFITSYNTYSIASYNPLFASFAVTHRTLLCNMSLKFVSAFPLAVSRMSSFLVKEFFQYSNDIDTIVDNIVFSELVLSEWCFIRIHRFITIIDLLSRIPFAEILPEADL